LVAKKGNNPTEWSDGVGGFVYAPPNARPSRRRAQYTQPLLSRHEFQRPPVQYRDDVPAVVVGDVTLRQRVDEPDAAFAERIERAREYRGRVERDQERAAIEATPKATSEATTEVAP
jgi:hypothetical protein